MTTDQIRADLQIAIDELEPVARALKKKQEKRKNAFKEADTEYQQVLSEYAALRNALATLEKGQTFPAGFFDGELGAESE